MGWVVERKNCVVDDDACLVGSRFKAAARGGRALVLAIQQLCSIPHHQSNYSTQLKLILLQFVGII
jgi:hypothetical protein